jgi:hypothetical protein
MSARSKRGRPWSRDNWCTAIIQPAIAGVLAYRCHNNGNYGGLCSVRRLQRQKREARAQKA